MAAASGAAIGGWFLVIELPFGIGGECCRILMAVTRIRLLISLVLAIAVIAGRIAPIDAAGLFPRPGSMMTFASGEEPEHTIAACGAIERFQEALPPSLRIVAPVPIHIQMFWLVSAIVFFCCLMARGMIAPIPLSRLVLHRRTYLLHSVLLI